MFWSNKPWSVTPCQGGLHIKVDTTEQIPRTTAMELIISSDQLRKILGWTDRQVEQDAVRIEELTKALRDEVEANHTFRQALSDLISRDIHAKL